MQLMPATARRFAVSDPFDARQNIMAGTQYLRVLLDQFQGDVTLALAAYNAGENAVIRFGGIPPFKETQGYVLKMQSAPRRWLSHRGGAAATAAAYYTPLGRAGVSVRGSAPALRASEAPRAGSPPHVLPVARRVRA